MLTPRVVTMHFHATAAMHKFVLSDECELAVLVHMIRELAFIEMNLRELPDPHFKPHFTWMPVLKQLLWTVGGVAVEQDE